MICGANIDGENVCMYDTVEAPMLFTIIKDLSQEGLGRGWHILNDGPVKFQ